MSGLFLNMKNIKCASAAIPIVLLLDASPHVERNRSLFLKLAQNYVTLAFQNFSNAFGKYSDTSSLEAAHELFHSQSVIGCLGMSQGAFVPA